MLKFFLVVLIVVGYFIFISFKYGAGQGFLITFLTWSAFVLCTPIADAGFLIDFPLRLITKIKMLVSEMLVWILAISVNLYIYFTKPEIYSKTEILSFFKSVLDELWPFGIIILLSMLGTFVSIQFGDELLDKAKHKERSFHQKHKRNYRLLIMIFIVVTTIIVYDFVLKKMGVHLPVYN